MTREDYVRVHMITNLINSRNILNDLFHYEDFKGFFSQYDELGTICNKLSEWIDLLGNEIENSMEEENEGS